MDGQCAGLRSGEHPGRRSTPCGRERRKREWGGRTEQHLAMPTSQLVAPVRRLRWLHPLHEVVQGIGLLACVVGDQLRRARELLGAEVPVLVGVRRLQQAAHRLPGVEAARVPILELRGIEEAVAVLVQLAEVGLATLPVFVRLHVVGLLLGRQTDALVTVELLLGEPSVAVLVPLPQVLGDVDVQDVLAVMRRVHREELLALEKPIAVGVRRLEL
mmetsp:Transcript_22843/g.64866  ORF Transcript_22843/g.64866 Transcript_22843/m.64866 type:complete len:216 (-) Transcript_22843:648-1295(-)